MKPYKGSNVFVFFKLQYFAELSEISNPQKLNHFFDVAKTAKASIDSICSFP